MKYASDKYYSEPPKTQEELDFRIREIHTRPGGGRNVGDYADLAKTDTQAVTSSKVFWRNGR